MIWCDSKADSTVWMEEDIHKACSVCPELCGVYFLPQRKGENMMKQTKINRLVKISMLSAVAALLMYMDIPLWFAPSFYKIDLSEVAAMVGAFAMGPIAGVAIEALKIVLILLIKGTHTGCVGEFANFLIGCALILPAAAAYQKNKSKKNAVLGMIAGTIFMTVIGSVINAYILIPAYAKAFNMPLDAIVGMGAKINGRINSVNTLVLYATVPFNILKGIIVGIITALLYKRISPILK